MALGQIILTNICSFALNWYFFIFIGLIVMDIYVRYFKTNRNTDIDLIEQYVKLELRRRYK